MIKGYPQYKDTKFEWLGALPSHWGLAKIGVLFDQRNEKVSDADFPALSVTKNGIVPQLENAAKTDAGDNRMLVRKGDFVINSRSDRKGSSGVSSLDGSVSLISIVLRPLEHNPRYIHHLFRSYNFQEEFYRNGKGIVADLWSTRYSEMKNIYIPVIPMDEQNSIADYLDKETSRIDGLISEKNNFINLLKEKRQALISHVVAKGLDPNVEMKDSGVEWIGKIPKHWTRKRLKHVISLIESGTSVNAANVQADPNQVAVLKTSSVYGGKFDPSKTKTVIDEDVSRVNCPLRKGSLIVSRMNTPDLVGSAGYVFDAPENIFLPDRLWQVEFNSATLPEFIYYWTLTDVYRNQVKISCEGTSSSMQNISQGDFKNYHLAVPSLEEQILIVDHIRSRASFIEKLIVEVNHSIDLLKEHRTALISSAVTGKIDLRDKEVA